MAWPTKLSEAFDLTSPQVETREIDQVREAARTRRIRPSHHALERARARGMVTADMLSIILNGEALEKDLPGNHHDRKPGIAFVGVGPSGIVAKVKVTFRDGVGYEIATIHEVGIEE